MNKARKPLSFLLALMMVLGLFAASPLTVLATSADGQADTAAGTKPVTVATTTTTPTTTTTETTGSETETADKTETVDKTKTPEKAATPGGGAATTTTTTSGLTPVPGGGSAAYALPVGGGSVTMPAGSCSFTPRESGFYTITAAGSNTVTATLGSVTATTSNIASLGKVDAAAYSDAEVYYLANDTTYTITMNVSSAAANATARLTAQKLSTSTSVSFSTGSGSKAVAISNNTGSTVYYLAAMRGVTANFKAIRGTGTTIDTNPITYTNLIPVPPYSVVGVLVTANGTGSVTFNKLTAPGRLNPTTAADAAAGNIYTYFQYTPNDDGLYILTMTATGNGVGLGGLDFVTVEITASNGDGKIEPISDDLYTARPTNSQATKADAYALKRNVTYLFTVKNEMTKPSGNTLIHPVTLSLKPLTRVSGTGGSVSIRSIALYDGSVFNSYEPSFFEFSPTKSGWYTFDAGQNPVTIKAIKGTNNDVNEPSPAGWANNLLFWDSYKAKASGYFQAGKDYFFEVKPVAASGLTGNSVPDLSLSIRISAANFPVLTNSAGTVNITGLAQGAVGYVYFKPTTTTKRSDVYAEPNDGTRFATGTNGIQKIYKVNRDSSNNLTVTEIASSDDLTAGTEYWIQVQSGTVGDGKDAVAGRVYLSAEAVQGVGAYVYSPVNDAANSGKSGAGYLDSAATVMQNGKIVEADKRTKTYTLTPGANYTLSGSAPGCYDRTIAFKGGEIPGMVLYPVPVKANLVDSCVGYTLSATAPAADSNIVRVKVGANFTDDKPAKGGSGTDDGFLIGINVPTSTNVKFGWGPYTSRESTSNRDLKTGGGSGSGDPVGKGYYFDPFLNDYTKAWIKVTYSASLDSTVSDVTLEDSVIYEIDFSGVTKFVPGVDDPTTVPAPVVVVPSVTGKAVGKGVSDTDAAKYVTSVASGALDSSYIDLVKNSSTVKGYITSAQNELKTLFDNQDRQSDGKTVTWRDYKIAYDEGGNIYNRANDWVSLREQLMNTVVVLPLIDMQLTDVEDYDSSKNALPTFKIAAYNRVLVTDADTADKTTFDISTITNRLGNGTLKKVADLDTNKANGVESGERIQVVQNGADRKVTVNDPTLITLGSSALSGVNFTTDTLYVIHTKDDGKVHVYELNNDTVLSSGGMNAFVSPYGLSTFKITDERMDSSKNRYEAAYILRDTNQGPCKIWYKTPAEAIADAENGDAVYLASGYAGIDISATNNKADSFVVFATDSTGNAVNLVAKVTINGKALNYATVVPGDQSSAGATVGVIAAVYGSGSVAGGKTVRVSTWTEGTIKVSNEYAKAGETVSVTVTPRTGMKVTGLNVTTNKGNIKVTVSGSNNYWSFTMPNGLGSTYDYVTVTPLSGNSVIIESKTGGSVTASSVRPNVGDTVTLTVMPYSGYSLSSLTARNTTTGRNVPLSKNSDTRYYFTMEDGGVTVTPTWRSTGVYVNTSTSGTVSTSSTEPATGERVMITVTPNSGNQLSSIKVRTNSGNQAVTTWKVNDSLYAFTKPSDSVSITTEWRTASSALPYTDNIASWAMPYVRDCYTGNLMSGIGSTFSGGSKIDRASVWTILARINGFYPETTGNPWYAESRSWIVDQGVSDGSSGGSSITREQLATMLYRFAGKPSTKGSLSSFPDRGQVHTDWADTENAMKWCVEKGIMSGDNGRLKPQANATRYEVAKMISVFADVTNK